MTTIALAGKGGSGKTTIAGLIINHLLKEGKKPVLAVDADPDSNLNEVLGVKINKTVISTVDEIMEAKENLPAGITKERLLEFHLQDAIVESKGFDLLIMGRTEGIGCYCRANDLLRNFMEKLKENYPYVVMDNEAGMEHLSRRTTRNLDILLIIANPTHISLKSAERIYEISKKLKLNIKKVYLVINELRTNSPVENINTELPILSRIPYDEKLLSVGIDGNSIFNLPEDSIAGKAVLKILDNLNI